MLNAFTAAGVSFREVTGAEAKGEVEDKAMKDFRGHIMQHIKQPQISMTHVGELTKYREERMTLVLVLLAVSVSDWSMARTGRRAQVHSVPRPSTVSSPDWVPLQVKSSL